MELRYILCILIILVLRSFSSYPLFENSQCHTRSTPGICRKLHDCPVALQAVIKNHKHNFKRCGFTNEDIELVCCPPVSSRYQMPIGKKSERYCKQYVDSSVEEVEETVTGGTDAEEKEFPHMAALAFNRSGNVNVTYECGGTLISDRFVLTAAHCFAYGAVPFRVRLGVTLLNDTDHVDVGIKNYTLHPRYDASEKRDDIALIELVKRVRFSDTIRPACLYGKPDDPLGLVVTGWGLTFSGETDSLQETNILQKAPLSAVSKEECSRLIERRSYGQHTMRPTQLCAIGNRKDSCDGDSGGPLQLRREEGGYAVVGIVSHGPNGCQGVIAAVYTRVSSYVQWIEDIVWKDEMEI